MDLKEAVTFAVALIFFLLMAATRSVKAGSCFDPSNDITSCNINEVFALTLPALTLTVLEQKTSLRSIQITKFKIDRVYKSDMQMTDKTIAEVRIPNGHACVPNLIKDMQYMLMANHIAYDTNEIQLCEYVEEGTYCQTVAIQVVMKESIAC